MATPSPQADVMTGRLGRSTFITPTPTSGIKRSRSDTPAWCLAILASAAQGRSKSG
jgi:hypothetical protein